MKTTMIESSKQQPSIETFADLPFHPDTAIVPRMTVQERKELTDDMTTHGQRDAIKVYQGQIVDGRERYEICMTLGMAPKIEEIDLPQHATIRDVVLSFNYHRRHLTDSQRAMIAARMSNTFLGANQSTEGKLTQKEAAAACQTSADSLQRARKVLNFGNGSLIEAVLEGRLDVFNAEKITKATDNKGIDLTAMTREGLRQLGKEAIQKANAVKREAAMSEVERKRLNNQPLPSGKRFGLLYADPAWDYLPEHEVGYPTMSLAEICAMKVPELAEDNAVLAMWVPAGQLAQGLEVVKAWGFEFKTSAVWDKELPTTGSYFQCQHELLFIATRGSPAAVPATRRPPSVFKEKRSKKHSRKPQSAYAMLEHMYEGLSKLELFARGPVREGWEGWGNECIHAQPEAEEVPKTLPKAKLPKVVKGKAANDAKVKTTKVASSLEGEVDASLKLAA